MGPADHALVAAPVGGGEEAHDGVGAEEGEELGLFDGLEEGDGLGVIEAGEGGGLREEFGAFFLGGG